MKEAIALLRREASSDRETADLHERNVRVMLAEIKTLQERLRSTENLVKKYRDKALEWEAAAANLEEVQ